MTNKLAKYSECKFASLILIALSIFGCKNSDQATVDPPPTVDVAPVLIQDIIKWDEYNGRISSVNAADIRPRVSGYVTKIAYSEGGSVRRGDLLFTIDQRSYLLALSASRAQLERAQATVKNTRLQDERAQALVAANATSREDAEQKRAMRDQSIADLNAAQAAVNIAQLNLEYTEVRAPFHGRASRAVVTVGNLATADQTVLTSVVSQDPVYVYFSPDEQSYIRYRSDLKTNREGYTAQIGIANGEDFPHQGDVKFTDNQINPSTGTIQMRAVIPNPGRLLIPGMYARVRISPRKKETVTLTTDRAIMREQDRSYVYVLDNGNTVNRKEIKLGNKFNGLRIVEAGLDPQDRIVVTGLQKIYAAGTVVAPKTINLKAELPTPDENPGLTN
ncbi:efflux RND transporter periplasmic adaptor subunit [Delftia acidovorans]|uniref:Efflux RND transporter periplasmic adaptor subunit n=1 Tax=Delftia acidovorans TaxID=80866 RepID=A0AAJ2R6D9_DELAC|nr:efflux RND transporter periplasmic adaptor subunit [Delftia acidovorans]MDX4956544.1 efflux RND transporter periplasmic adaptor subunit [Delftia acidovorans]